MVKKKRWRPKLRQRATSDRESQREGAKIEVPRTGKMKKESRKKKCWSRIRDERQSKEEDDEKKDEKEEEEREAENEEDQTKSTQLKKVWLSWLRNTEATGMN